MADFLMPSLGADMDAGTVLQWLVKPGDAVKRGDIVAVIDTEKTTIEVEIFQTGIIQKIVVPEGEKVPVGTLLAVLSTEGEAAAAAPEAKRAAPAPLVLAPAPPTPPAAARVVAKTTPKPAAPHRVRISPLAMRVAMELKVDLAAIKGTGPEGAITKTDVEPLDRPATMRKVIAAAMARSKREIPHYYLGTHIDMSKAMRWLQEEN